jgi:ferredoxin
MFLTPIKRSVRAFNTKEFLQNEGFTISEIESIERAFAKMGGEISPSSLKQMGKKGIESLLVSVEREEASKAAKEAGPKVKVTIEFPGGNSSVEYEIPEGDTLQDLVEGNDELSLYMEYACGGIAACSTCHVIIDDEHFPLLEPPEEAELDMVDLAYGACETSRLGCQVCVPRAAEGMRIKIPDGVNNLH